MGLFDKLKEKSRGILTEAKPAAGVEPAPADQVKSRLLAISGKGIETGEDGDELVVSWSAQVDSAGAGGAAHEYRYRAIRLKLNADDHEASGICFKTIASLIPIFSNALFQNSSPSRMAGRYSFGIALSSQNSSLAGVKRVSRSWTPSGRKRGASYAKPFHAASDAIGRLLRG